MTNFHTAANLDELCNLLNSTDTRGLDLSGLPTFGDEEPACTLEIYSWDNRRVLTQCTTTGLWELENRTGYERWLELRDEGLALGWTAEEDDAFPGGVSLLHPEYELYVGLCGDTVIFATPEQELVLESGMSLAAAEKKGREDGWFCWES